MSLTHLSNYWCVHIFERGRITSPTRSLIILSSSKQNILRESSRLSRGIKNVSFHLGFFPLSWLVLVRNFLSRYYTSMNGSISDMDSVSLVNSPSTICRDSDPPRAYLLWWPEIKLALFLTFEANRSFYSCLSFFPPSSCKESEILSTLRSRGGYLSTKASFSIWIFFFNADLRPLMSGEAFWGAFNCMIDLDLSKDFFGTYEPTFVSSS